MNWQDALNQLKTGNNRFVTDQLIHPNSDNSTKNKLTKGQQPWAIILSCADSRVVPELMFDTGLGELFVIRVAGNVANTSSIASIEYAVAHLGTKLIVVLGHQSCGAVTAAIHGGDNGPNLNHLLEHIAPAVTKANSQEINEVVKVNAQLTTNNLTQKSTIIQGHVTNHGVKIVPAFYSLESGEVDFLA